MMRARNLFISALVSGLLSACSGADMAPRSMATDDVTTFEKNLRPNLDLTTVLVARLELDERVIEVTSLFPTALPTTLEPRTGPARTWLVFDEEKTKLLVLTRAKDGTAQGFELPVLHLKKGASVTLPITQTDGSVKSTRVFVREFIQKP